MKYSPPQKENKSLSTWQLLTSRRDFVKLITARFVSMMGDYVHTVTTMWLVKEMTGSALAMASIFIANTIPRIIFALLGGVSVDRYNRKTILVLSDSLRAVGVLGLVLLAKTSQLQVWHVAVFAAFNGAVASFFGPAVSATIPNIVEQGELQKANALNGMSVRIAGILGGALGGIILGLAGTWGGYLVDAASYATSALLIFGMAIPNLSQIRSQPIPLGFSGVWQDMKSGWTYILSQRWLLAVVVISVITTFVTLPAAQLIPTLADELKLTDPTQLGFLWSGMTLGMFLGAFFLNSVRQIPNKIFGVLISAFLCAISSVMIGLTQNYFVVLSGFVLMGFSLSLSTLLTTTLFQTFVPKEMQGRFFSNTDLLTLGIQPLVMGLAGLVADWSSATTIFVMLGSSLIVFSLLWTLQCREYLKSPIPLRTINTDY
jgi:MFS transporter, DHA3 family, macrolide efflux protein